MDIRTQEAYLSNLESDSPFHMTIEYKYLLSSIPNSCNELNNEHQINNSIDKYLKCFNYLIWHWVLNYKFRFLLVSNVALVWAHHSILICFIGHVWRVNYLVVWRSMQQTRASSPPHISSGGIHIRSWVCCGMKISLSRIPTAGLLPVIVVLVGFAASAYSFVVVVVAVAAAATSTEAVAV